MTNIENSHDRVHPMDSMDDETKTRFPLQIVPSGVMMYAYYTYSYSFDIVNPS